MQDIKNLKVLDKSLKRSFSNVRQDVLVIKEYLEKQHDLISEELSELQSQVYKIRREQKDSKRPQEEKYVRKKELDDLLHNKEQTLSELQDKISEVEISIKELSGAVDGIEKDSISSINDTGKKLRSDFKKANSGYQKDLETKKKEIDNEQRRLFKEQSETFEKKLAKLNKSIKQVDELKDELKSLIKQSTYFDKGSFAQLEKQVSDKSLLQRIWGGVVDFFEEEEIERKPAKKKTVKKESSMLPFILGFLFIALIIFGGWYYRGVITEYFTGSEEITDDIIVIEVSETDFVNIMPNVSDDDNNVISYEFSYPLNKSGQWQTQIGDAGSYPITVIVSDGYDDTTMDFLLVVNPKE